MSAETIFTNAVLVLPDAVFNGTLVMHGDTIAEVAAGRSRAPGAIDLDGDYLIPGVVDVHTDNLERQVLPRSLARWPSRSAMVAHDAQCAAAGVTTILDALCLGDLGFDTGRIQTFHDGVVDLDALTPTGLLKSQHYLHLRCEIPALDMLRCFDTVAEHPLVRMISLMDHSPGVGQYADFEFYRNIADAGRAGRGDGRSPHRRIAAATRAGAGAEPANVTRPCAWPRHRSGEPRRPHGRGNRREFGDGIRISEFPVTDGGGRGGERCGDGRDRRSAELGARRLAFGQYRGGGFVAGGLGGCVRVRLCAAGIGRSGVPGARARDWRNCRRPWR